LKGRKRKWTQRGYRKFERSKGVKEEQRRSMLQILSGWRPTLPDRVRREGGTRNSGIGKKKNRSVRNKVHNCERASVMLVIKGITGRQGQQESGKKWGILDKIRGEIKGDEMLHQKGGGKEKVIAKPEVATWGGLKRGRTLMT